MSSNSTATIFNPTDTAFVFANSALVMFMIPGLALFYSGMVRQKNALHTALQSIVALLVVSIQWFFWGFSLAFSSGNKVYGNLDYILLLFFDTNMITEAHPVAPTVPMLIFMVYQLMFAAITAAIISGGPAERLRFRSYVLFLFMWTTLVYCPVTHWVYAPKGWLFGKVLDFAGGTTVHISSGAASLAFSIVLKGRDGYSNLLDKLKDKILRRNRPDENSKKTDQESPVVVTTTSTTAITTTTTTTTTTEVDKKEEYPKNSIAPHNMLLMMLGTGMLWFGWFGFNGGSALSPNGLACVAFVNTNLAGAAGGIVWMCVEFIFTRKMKAIGACNGAVCGLAAVTPAAGFIYPGFAVICGSVAAVLCFFTCMIKSKLIDDSLDPFGIHCVGGIFGVLFTGVFAVREIVFQGSGVVIAGGWWNANWKQIGYQFAAIGSIFGWSFVMTVIIIVILWLIPFFGLRVSEYEERLGMDYSQHGESAYVFDFSEVKKELLFEAEDSRDDLVSMIYQTVKRRSTPTASASLPTEVL